MDWKDLERMTVLKLREEALKYPQIEGVHGKHKEQLMDEIAGKRNRICDWNWSSSSTGKREGCIWPVSSYLITTGVGSNRCGCHKRAPMRWSDCRIST